MSLPKVAIPTHELEIPSTKQKVKFRPYLVKEEKLLLMAKESLAVEGKELEAYNDIFETVLNVIDACLIDDVDVTTLTRFDVDFMFCNIVSVSVDEIVDGLELPLNCPDKQENCPEKLPTSLNLKEDVNVFWPDNHFDKVELDDKFGVKFRYPAAHEDWEAHVLFNEKGEDLDEQEITLNIMASTIESIYEINGDSVWLISEYTRDELKEWIDSLRTEQYGKLFSFVETFPRTQGKLTATCPECGHVQETNVNNLLDFFV